MIRKLIFILAVLVLNLAMASISIADMGNVKATKNASVASSAPSNERNNISQVVDIPPLLRSIPNESETDKLKRMVQFIKNTSPTLLPNKHRSQTHCNRFMDDLINMRVIKAIEPDFISESEEEVTDKHRLKHCEDIEPYSIIPPDVNPSLYMRGSYGFNNVSDLGGPPYRIYKVQLMPGIKAKHYILYYNAIEFFDEKYGMLSYAHTGFARIDVKKCEIKDEKSARSEISTLYEIGRNVLLKYKGQIFTLTIDYGVKSISYRLELQRFGIPITKGIDNCLWTYWNEKHKSDNLITESKME
jgi:hypothetical protein